MGVVTVLMVLFGALLGTCALTVLLDSLAQYCFRPLQAIESAAQCCPAMED